MLARVSRNSSPSGHDASNSSQASRTASREPGPAVYPELTAAVALSPDRKDVAAQELPGDHPASNTTHSPFAPRIADASPATIFRKCDSCAEQEIPKDHPASDTTRSPFAPRIAEATPPMIFRKCDACAEEEEEQTMRPGGGRAVMGKWLPDGPPLVSDLLHSGGGRQLDPVLRAYFEPRFGYDLGAVRIHRNTQADASARSVNALAYTVGHDVVFRNDAYAPDTVVGRKLIAHELTHSLQQSGAGAPAHAGAPKLSPSQRQQSPGHRAHGGHLEISHPHDAAEREADTVAEAVLNSDAQDRRPAVHAGKSRGKDALSSHGPTHVLQQTTHVYQLSNKIQRQVPSASYGVAQVLEAISCLSGLFDEMVGQSRWYLETACTDGNYLISLAGVRYIPEDRPDAFGHCWIGCQGAKTCGEGRTRSYGAVYENYRELQRIFGIRGHNSYEEDTSNQRYGRELARNNPDADCSSLCYQAVVSGALTFHGGNTAVDLARRRVYNCSDITIDGHEYPRGWRTIPHEHLSRF